jgi:osmotically-inducible protein OsmY
MVFFKKFRNRLLLIVILSWLICGCTAVSITTSGAQALYDRHAIEENVTNYHLATMIDHQLKNDPEFKGSHIRVTAFHYEILLTGTALTEALKFKAAKIAAHYNSVNYVYNFITIGSKTEDYQQLLHDCWLTTKIKGKIIAQAKISPRNIKVLTVNNVVYLMGFLTPREANIATHTARYTSGVKKVVVIFQYISYSTVPPRATG